MSFELLQQIRELQVRVLELEAQVKELQEKRPPLPPGPKRDTLTLKKANGASG